MKIKACYITILLLLCHFCVNANVVTAATAQTIAVNFYKATTNASASPAASLNYTQLESDGSVDFYVFDINPAGFVIVSATDNVIPVLAYSTESNFRSDFPEVGIKGWMQHTAADIHQAQIQNTPASLQTTRLWTAYLQGTQLSSQRSSVVSPMLSTAWGQAPYYNMLCPYDSSNHAQAVTGCLATAMAQIMKYWSYPSRGVGSFSYLDAPGQIGYSWNVGTVSADFSATTYQWSQMPANLTDYNADVATLLFQCGASMGMNYGAHGSSAYLYNNPGHPSAFNSFTAYFSYNSQTIQFVEKTSYTSAAWQSLILSELNQGRPVFYSGQDTGNIGGHAWVCDGYDANGMLHMNWGWAGADNGYFTTVDLNPGTQNWSWTQAAIIGIQPDASALAVNTVSEDPGFKLFPNPANNKITIKGHSDGTAVDYTIYNVVGNKMSEGTFTENTNIIDLSSFTTGLYFARLQSGQKQTKLRFVVEK